MLPTAAAGLAVLSHQVTPHLELSGFHPGGMCWVRLGAGLPFPRVHSEGARMRWQQGWNPCNKASGYRMHSRQCRRVCSIGRDLFTTHSAVIVSWWSWKHSSVAPKIEYTAPEQICVLCPSVQKGVLGNLPVVWNLRLVGLFPWGKPLLINTPVLAEGLWVLVPCSG